MPSHVGNCTTYNHVQNLWKFTQYLGRHFDRIDIESYAHDVFEIFVGTTSDVELSIATAEMCNCTSRCTYCTFCCNKHILASNGDCMYLESRKYYFDHGNGIYGIVAFFLCMVLFVVRQVNQENQVFEVTICDFVVIFHKFAEKLHFSSYL